MFGRWARTALALVALCAVALGGASPALGADIPVGRWYSARAAGVPQVISPTPTTPTVIAGLSVTVPGGAAARTVLVWGQTVKEPGGAANYVVQIGVDGVRVGVAIVPGVPGDGDGRVQRVWSAVPVVVPGDGLAHSLDVMLEAQGSTGASTITDGWMSVLDPSGVVTVDVAGGGSSAPTAEEVAFWDRVTVLLNAGIFGLGLLVFCSAVLAMGVWRRG